MTLLASCGGERPPAGPSSADARTALVATLDAWKSGRKPGPIEGTPPIFAVDSAWQSGQKLAGYEVLGDEPVDGVVAFNVRLSLVRPDRREETRYLIMGRSPINVMREDDFRRNASMEDAPAPAPRPRRR